MPKPENHEQAGTGTIRQAMDGADQSAKTEAAAAVAVEKALSEGMGRPTFNTHSTALAGEFAAKAASIKAQVAEVDDKIAHLNAERDDLMLAYSMLSHGMTAREKGARN